MNNLLLIINSLSTNTSALNFACFLAKKANMRITGLFIENIYETNHGWVDPYTGVLVNSEKNGAIFSINHPKTGIDRQISYFKELCRKDHIPFNYITISGEPINATLHETRFSDFAVIDPELNFYEGDRNIPSYYIKEILSHTECPIIISPEKFTQLEDIYFCYDNSPSSVFAIKQFTYLFPRLTSTDATLLEIKDVDDDKDSLTEEHKKMINWLKYHYNNVYFQFLKGDANDNLFSSFFMKQNKIIVMGAYGRSLLSNFFKRSHADILIRSVDLPLFIAHH